jgi:type I restriction enzyme, S subunit
MSNKNRSIKVTLNDIAKWGSGGTPLSTNSEYYDGDIPWVIIGDLNDGYISSTNKKITFLGLKNSSAKMIQPENVLIAMYGSIGKLAINKISLTSNQAIAYTEKIFIGINNLYLFYYLLQSRSRLLGLGKGGTQKNISQTVLKAFDFPLFPSSEQRAIVAKIEQLFSELDNGIACLKKAQEQLKVYRQAILKQAFEGELSKAWREQQASLPSAQELLDHIKVEREQAAKKQGKKQKPLPPFSPAELDELPELPKEWDWTFLENITLEITDGDHQPPPKSNSGVPFITISSIDKAKNTIDFSASFHVSDAYYSSLKEHRKPRINDILYTVTGSFGIPVLIDFDKPFCFQRHIGLIRPVSEIIPEWLFYLLQNNHVSQQAQNVATGTAQKTVALNRLRQFVIPLCSPQEQAQIVQELETRLSVCDNMETTIKESLEKAEALRQSVLKKAFDGKLLSEEELQITRNAPDWEPAEKLLERIRAEKNNRSN